ncbi:hypothetical protein HWI79_3592 [Cryptosporidium felis]|nr:hypothetical protein HWI79_3592 [Cryptosporidium felis]
MSGGVPVAQNYEKRGGQEEDRGRVRDGDFASDRRRGAFAGAGESVPKENHVEDGGEYQAREYIGNDWPRQLSWLLELVRDLLLWVEIHQFWVDFEGTKLLQGGEVRPVLDSQKQGFELLFQRATTTLPRAASDYEFGGELARRANELVLGEVQEELDGVSFEDRREKLDGPGSDGLEGRKGLDFEREEAGKQGLEVQVVQVCLQLQGELEAPQLPGMLGGDLPPAGLFELNVVAEKHRGAEDLEGAPREVQDGDRHLLCQRGSAGNLQLGKARVQVLLDLLRGPRLGPVGVVEVVLAGGLDVAELKKPPVSRSQSQALKGEPVYSAEQDRC